MKKQTIQYFFLGILIAFSVSVLMLSAIMPIAFHTATVPVKLICQSFILSILCSLINLVYSSEKMKFIWQSIIGYILTTATITACGLIFGWYSIGGNSCNRISTVLGSFLVTSLCYLITWIIIWQIAKAKGKELNDKLKQYKQKQ